MGHQGREEDSYLHEGDTWLSYPALSYDEVLEAINVWREKACAVLHS